MILVQQRVQRGLDTRQFQARGAIFACLSVVPLLPKERRRLPQCILHRLSYTTFYPQITVVAYLLEHRETGPESEMPPAWL